MNGIAPLKEILDRAFLPEQIKQRKGNFGETLSYVETHSVIDRLNEAFDYKWSWEILSSEVKGRQIICIGRLTVKLDGETVIKDAFGSAEIELHKGTNVPVNLLADDLKAACSDAIKKAASLLGIGLHLYRGKTVPAPVQPVKNNGNNNNGNGKNGKIIQMTRYEEYAKSLRA